MVQPGCLDQNTTPTPKIKVNSFNKMSWKFGLIIHLK